MNLSQATLVGSLVAGLCLAPVVVSAAPITVGQIDTFEGGTTENWITAPLGAPNPNPPTVQPGGMGGALDHYLNLTSNGQAGQPGSRLTALNETQWAGDYLAAGITDIGADVNNFGNTDLYLRLAFEDPAGAPPTNVAFSTNAIFVPAGSGWTHINFDIEPAFLTAGLGSVDAALSNTTALRIYHSQNPGFPNPVFPIPAVLANLGVDNIQAIQAVPEPATLLLIAGGFAVSAARRRRSARTR